MASLAISSFLSLGVFAPASNLSKLNRRSSKSLHFSSQGVKLQRGSRLVVRSSSPSSTLDLNQMIREGIQNAESACSDPNSEECAVAWDEVEELTTAAADRRQREKDSASSDPLEAFCESNPEADECRTYSD
eukprot:jgi/Mesen1/10682/ME000009S10471